MIIKSHKKTTKEVSANCFNLTENIRFLCQIRKYFANVDYWHNWSYNENYLVVPLYSNPFFVVVNFNWDFYKKKDQTAALNDSAVVENINTGWQDITEQRNHN